MEGSSYVGCDGDKGVDIPTFCVESLDEWVTFGGFLEAIAVGNLSRQYVNSMDYAVFGGKG